MITDKREDRHGHPRFYEIIEELADLHSRKNYDYASGGDPLGNFKRVARIFSAYPNLDLGDPSVIALVYAMKQVDATLWLLNNKHGAKVEGTSERLQDVAVYSMITMIMEEAKVKKPLSDETLENIKTHFRPMVKGDKDSCGHPNCDLCRGV
jgi:hypothetical protein